MRARALLLTLALLIPAGAPRAGAAQVDPPAWSPVPLLAVGGAARRPAGVPSITAADTANDSLERRLHRILAADSLNLDSLNLLLREDSLGARDSAALRDSSAHFPRGSRAPDTTAA